MTKKQKYYIVYPHKSVEDLQWECTTHYRCRAHIPNMLQQLLGVKTVGDEIKLIWNHQHEAQMIKEYEVTYSQLRDYIKASCCMISFTAKGTRKRAIEHLKRLGAKEMCLSDNYRDVIILQAHYHNNKSFPENADVI